MNKNETKAVIDYLNGAWAQKPMGPDQEAIWSRKLGGMDLRAVMQALDRLTETSEFRPSMARIMAEANADQLGETPGEAFKSVLAAMIYAVDQRKDKISAKAGEAVRQLGGWGAVGLWERDSMSFHQRDFERVFGYVSEREADCDRLGRLGLAQDAREAVRAASVPREPGRDTGGPAAPDAGEFCPAPWAAKPPAKRPPE